MDGERRIGRAVFLTSVAGGLSSLLWGKPVWDRVSGAVSPVAGTLVPVLPTQGWRIYTVADRMPAFDPSTWKLEVGGRVERPLTLSYDELRALPRAEQTSDFHCVTGWSVRNVRWAGVRLKDVFAEVKPTFDAHGVEFVSAEVPYVDYLTTRQALLRDVMLAYEMDGKPLAREHGAPVRLVIPDMYGYKNVKWVSAVNLVPAAADGYWELLGYDRNAWVGRSNGYSS
jgi:DMSO/TMAO reductase YedYZ molybdopterin-dependent catalytic subunit